MRWEPALYLQHSPHSSARNRGRARLRQALESSCAMFWASAQTRAPATSQPALQSTHVLMELPARRQTAAGLEALGSQLCGRQHCGHLQCGLQRMPLGVGMRLFGHMPNPCACPAVSGRIPRMEGSACTAHWCTSQTLQSERLAVRLVLLGSTVRTECTVWSARWESRSTRRGRRVSPVLPPANTLTMVSPARGADPVTNHWSTAQAA